MLQMIIQGRGGQGAQTAGNLLAAAWFAAGWQVQCFATYGGARRGTPVSSFLRVDARPVRVRCDIERADAILCFDASLLAPPLLRAADAHTLVVVNSARPAADFAEALPRRNVSPQLTAFAAPEGRAVGSGAAQRRLHVLPLDALAIAHRHGLGRIVNSALLGGFVRATAGAGAPSLELLEATLDERAGKMTPQNIAACQDGWRAVDDLLLAEAAQ